MDNATPLGLETQIEAGKRRVTAEYIALITGFPCTVMYRVHWLKSAILVLL